MRSQSALRRSSDFRRERPCSPSATIDAPRRLSWVSRQGVIRASRCGDAGRCGHWTSERKRPHRRSRARTAGSLRSRADAPRQRPGASLAGPSARVSFDPHRGCFPSYSGASPEPAPGAHGPECGLRSCEARTWRSSVARGRPPQRRIQQHRADRAPLQGLHAGFGQLSRPTPPSARPPTAARLAFAGRARRVRTTVVGRGLRTVARRAAVTRAIGCAPGLAVRAPLPGPRWPRSCRARRERLAGGARALFASWALSPPGRCRARLPGSSGVGARSAATLGARAGPALPWSGLTWSRCALARSGLASGSARRGSRTRRLRSRWASSRTAR